MIRRLCGSLLALVLAASAAAAPVNLDAALRDVERIRHLKFDHEVRSVSIERAKLPDYLRDQITKSLPYSFDDYMLILESLRLVDPATRNPEARMIDLMQQQVLAFYDPLSHIYYAIDSLPPDVPQMAKAFGLERAVAVHELTHALQDQRFHIGATDLALRDDADASLAFHSVVEGEASLVMLARMVEPTGQTVDTITANDNMIDAIGGAVAMMQTPGDETPRYFVESLAIPYTAGLRFVVEAYRRGGWNRVNQIYGDLPRSMRDILHPDEYFAGRRTINTFSLQPPLPVPHLLTVEHLGEWHWRFLLGAGAVHGWKGDRVTVSQDANCEATVLVETQWDSPAEARTFQDAYAAFLEKEHVAPHVRASGNRVDVAYGPDDALIEKFIAPPGPQ